MADHSQLGPVLSALAGVSAAAARLQEGEGGRPFAEALEGRMGRFDQGMRAVERGQGDGTGAGKGGIQQFVTDAITSVVSYLNL